jgi:hypothetical protein
LTVTGRVAGKRADMLSRFADLPNEVQKWLLCYFTSATEADRWLHRRHPDYGCTPLQLLEFPPGLSRLDDMVGHLRPPSAEPPARGGAIA